MDDAAIGNFESLDLSSGLHKVVKFCQVAKRRGYQWAWIDTVCIDKTNLTELTEAINPMLRWYRDSARCFVYLHDCTRGNGKTTITRSEW
jgi:hypothetical protein